MINRISVTVLALTTLPWILLLAPSPAASQGFWSEDTPKLPMAASWLAQKAELPPYDPPRTANGVPDLQGFWGSSGGDGLSTLEENEYIDITTPAQESYVSVPADGKVPYTPWGLAKRNEILHGLGRGWPGETGERLYSYPVAYCLDYMPNFSVAAIEIIQQSDAVIILSATGHRVIPMDGRPPMNENTKLWFGNSRGHWEGNTLVVEVTNLNGLGWFDSTGHIYTENTRLTERWTLADADTIDFEVTIDDPTLYTQPWKMNFPKRRPGTGPRLTGRHPSAITIDAPRFEDPYANEVWENGCYEGNGESQAALRALGYQWYRGVTPPQ
jgi:hypothetical protein